MIFRKSGIFLITIRLIQSKLILFVKNIRKTLKEKQRKNISFEISRIDWATQNIGRLPEMTEKTALIEISGNLTLWHYDYP